MALKPVKPGLRPFWNKTNDVAKIGLAVPAGDQIMVSDDVAAQLGVAFAEGEAPSEPGPNVVTAPSIDEPAPVAAEEVAIESDAPVDPEAPKRGRKPKG